MLAVFGAIGVWVASGIVGDAQLRFRPESEREAMGKTGAYADWVQTEGIPIYRGQAIPRLQDLKLGPWKRTGMQGAYVILEGTGGLIDGFVAAIAPGASSKPEKHMFEENIMILEGEGETEVWLPGKQAQKQTIHWRPGSVFSPPLNTWHQHFNKGTQEAKFVSVTNAPFVMDFFHTADMLFNIETAMTDRYDGDAMYFDPEKAKDYAPYKGKHSLTLVNFVRDVRSAVLSTAGQGYGDVDRHYVLSNNRMGTHVESFPVGTYERGHRHGPGASIIFIGGTGYSLYWHKSAGDRPFEQGNGDKVQKVDWQNGTMFVPDNDWYHQHFNTGKEPARFIKLGSPFGPGGGNTVFRMEGRFQTEGGSHMINYRDEDPKIREMFEAELKKHGAPLLMPSVKELTQLEIEAEKNSGGMLQQVKEPQ
jgi:quercetin dioxygenase-like cupin family protein